MDLLYEFWLEGGFVLLHKGMQGEYPKNNEGCGVGMNNWNTCGTLDLKDEQRETCSPVGGCWTSVETDDSRPSVDHCGIFKF